MGPGTVSRRNRMRAVEEGSTVTIEITEETARRSVVGIYNSAVAAWAIGAAWEVGALDELRERQTLDAEEFAARRGLDLVATVGMFRALAAVDVVEREHTAVRVSTNFDEVYRNKSFFHWLSRGNADVFRQMPSVLAGDNAVGEIFKRDAAAIAFACREMNELCYDPTFWAAMDRLDFPFRTVADLGCGSGGRVMDVLNRYPGTRGIGIDIARPSLEVARRELAEAGLGDRAIFLEGDVLQLAPRPEYAEVDLLTSFMMGHDFWPRERCVATLRRLREVFPNVRRFLLGDATRTVGVHDADLPIFTLGFELGHDLMGSYLPTLADWDSVFEEGGWRLVRTNRIDFAVGEVIFELE
jgi:SAM-dependent methyltransferase